MSERVHVMPRGGGLLEFYSIGIILKLGLHYDEMFDDDRLSEGGIGECE